MPLVYQAINLINGKRYIGSTVQALAKRRDQHKCEAGTRRSPSAFHRALRKYGAGLFRFSVLRRCADLVKARAEERRLVALLKPDYNAKAGGSGPSTLGGRISEDGRRRISEANRGNTYRRGRPHSRYAREALRAIGLRDRERWLQRSHLGPAALSRPVRRLDDGRIFPSAREAARLCGVSHTALTELCQGKRGRRTVGGMRFQYAEAP